MAHIVGYKIKGLLGKSSTLERALDRSMNVFIGGNGTGKTSILRILDAAMNCDHRAIRRTAFQSAEVEIYSLNARRSFLHKIYSVQPQKEQQTLPGIPKSIFRIVAENAANDELTPEKHRWRTEPALPSHVNHWLHSYLPTSRLYLGSPQQPGSAATANEDRLDLLFETKLQTSWTNYYSSVLAAVKNAQQDGLRKILETALGTRVVERESSLTSEQAYSRIASFMARQEINGPVQNPLGPQAEFTARYTNNAQLRSIVYDIDQIENSIAVALARTTRIQALISAMFSNNKKLEFSHTGIRATDRSGEPIHIRDLSSGEKHLLMLLVETVDADENTIIIDEPELSLHIDWQRALLSCLRELNPSAQFIIATHSPEILAGANNNNIINLR